MTMKQVGGIWLPEHEKHMDAWMVNRMRTHPKELVDGKYTYQYHKFLTAMSLVKNFGVAVDVGAHCGLWSMHLAKRFDKLYAFEPIALHRECFNRNVAADNVMLIGCALGEVEGQVAFHVTSGSSGDSYVTNERIEDAVNNVPVKRLDNTHPALDHDEPVDFIKLDCEGYELFALRGGEELLKRSHPAVCVEQKPGKAQTFGLGQTDAVTYLRGLGAVLRKEIGGDYFLSWD